MLKALAHACYTVRDLDAAIDFYVGKLGMTQAFDFINDKGERYGVYLHVAGRSFIELFTGTHDASQGGSYRHICLEVEDVAQAVEILRERGVEISDAKLGMDNSWQAWITDPDGNRLELHSYTSESWQAPALQ
ncbi:MAG: VOC family protein [Acidobacteriota bacterium]|nr:VOC family protein [Acidobacteriota bacterium]